MDVQQLSRERVFSILNDNDCPSFVIRSKPSPSKHSSPNRSSPSLYSSKIERPNLLRQTQYSKRNSSISSTATPPLVRYDSEESSKSSNYSMDSTPSPITPAYNYNDAGLSQYDTLLRQDLTGYLPSPTTITPFMEQHLLINGNMDNQLPPFAPKSMPALAPQYPSIPIPTDVQQLPTPTSSTLNSANSTAVKTSPTSTTSNSASLPAKKNKYPCPYAQSHNCLASFTTSGHAARHGKKHTGEKGVHCPICNKAFTRKDNMKQHERTHKNNSNGEDNKRSKAAMTKDAEKKKHPKVAVEQPVAPAPALDFQSTLRSPLSESTSLGAPPSLHESNSLDLSDSNSTQFYQDSVNAQILLSGHGALPDGMALNGSLYPPLADDALTANATLPPITKMDDLSSLVHQSMPPLMRGFSDLDTLAQAAESFDPYYSTGAI